MKFLVLVAETIICYGMVVYIIYSLVLDKSHFVIYLGTKVSFCTMKLLCVYRMDLVLMWQCMYFNLCFDYVKLYINLSYPECALLQYTLFCYISLHMLTYVNYVNFCGHSEQK